jgi:hypothetical protein
MFYYKTFKDSEFNGFGQKKRAMTYIPLEFVILHFLRCQIAIEGFLDSINDAVVVGFLVELEGEDIFQSLNQLLYRD